MHTVHAEGRLSSMGCRSRVPDPSLLPWGRPISGAPVYSEKPEAIATEGTSLSFSRMLHLRRRFASLYHATLGIHILERQVPPLVIYTLCKVRRLTPSRCPRRASIAVAHTWQLGLGTSRTAPPHCRYSTISVRDDQASTAQGNRGRVSRPNNTADHSWQSR